MIINIGVTFRNDSQTPRIINQADMVPNDYGDPHLACHESFGPRDQFFHGKLVFGWQIVKSLAPYHLSISRFIK